MSFTVWSYDHDAAAHHANELNDDTFADLAKAVEVARQRVVETNHNTGWAKIIDNDQAGKMGDSGVIAIFEKDSTGAIVVSDIRNGYEKAIQSPASEPELMFSALEIENRLSVGSKLFTRDGRFIGNAEVTDWAYGTGLLSSTKVYAIKTDFGNTAQMTAKEINTAFYLDRD